MQSEASSPREFNTRGALLIYQDKLARENEERKQKAKDDARRSLIEKKKAYGNAQLQRAASPRRVAKPRPASPSVRRSASPAPPSGSAARTRKPRVPALPPAGMKRCGNPMGTPHKGAARKRSASPSRKPTRAVARPPTAVGSPVCTRMLSAEDLHQDDALDAFLEAEAEAEAALAAELDTSQAAVSAGESPTAAPSDVHHAHQCEHEEVGAEPVDNSPASKCSDASPDVPIARAFMSVVGAVDLADSAPPEVAGETGGASAPRPTLELFERAAVPASPRVAPRRPPRPQAVPELCLESPKSAEGSPPPLEKDEDVTESAERSCQEPLSLGADRAPPALPGGMDTPQQQTLVAMSDQLEAVISCMRVEQQARFAAEAALEESRAEVASLRDAHASLLSKVDVAQKARESEESQARAATNDSHECNHLLRISDRSTSPPPPANTTLGQVAALRGLLSQLQEENASLKDQNASLATEIRALVAGESSLTLSV